MLAKMIFLSRQDCALQQKHNCFLIFLRIVLVHNTQYKDSWPNDAWFVHKLYKHASFI